MTKIGFDGKRAVQNFTGLGNYSRYLLEAMQNCFPENEYILYAPRERENPRLAPLLGRGNMRLRLPEGTVWKKLRPLWRVWGVTNDLATDGIRIYHGLSNELPLNIRKAAKVKSVVTIHDLIFRRLPECYPTIDRWIYDYKFRRACRLADRIIAVSECTKRDIVKDYHIPPEKIEVICQGCDPAFAEEVPVKKKEEVRQHYALPEHYILSVGTIERRKNALLAVKALAHLAEEMHLVLVGKETAYAQEVRKEADRLGLSRRIHLRQGIPFADLPAIYQCAEVFIYPSFYEGFGIPILEALNSRVPVVAATGSCLEEAGGAHSIYVNPDDVEGAAEAISQAMHPETRHCMVEEGIKWAARFNATQMAQQTMECYERLMGK